MVTKSGVASFFRHEGKVYFFGFLLNFVWEVSQIPFYQGWNMGRIWFGENTVAGRGIFVWVFWEASLADALNILICYWFLSAIFKDRLWYLKGGYLFGNSKKQAKRIQPWIGMVAMGLICGIAIAIGEIYAISTGMWGYSEIMPLIAPKIGLIPVLGMFLSPPLVMLLASFGNRHTYILD